jgi:hypothetical protein
MPFTVEKSTQLIRVTYTGTLDNKDITGVLQDSLTMEGSELNLINRLEDMRNLRGIKIGFDDLMEFTKNLRVIQLPKVVKSAILTGNPLQYGIARMFQTILEHPQMNIKVFSNEEEALRWISTID